MSNRPKGISEFHWRFYRQGYEAREAGQDKDESSVIQDRVTRSWWTAGWIDCDIELTESDDNE
jgi:ribosome modulation factor